MGNKEADKVWGDGDELAHVDMVIVVWGKHSVGIAGGSGNGLVGQRQASAKAAAGMVTSGGRVPGPLASPMNEIVVPAAIWVSSLYPNGGEECPNGMQDYGSVGGLLNGKHGER